MTLVGAGAVALAAPGAAPVAAVAVPGQPVENDYGQSAVEVTAEVNPVVAANANVIKTKAAQVKAYNVLVARAKAQATAKAAYRAAVRSHSPTRVKRTYAAYRAAIIATANAKTAYAAAVKSANATRAIITARVRATHYQPKDGVWTGVKKSYLVPSIPISFEPMQVEITVYGGHVSDIAVVARADVGTESDSYNNMSLSTLMIEAMSSGDTADIAAVSGASLTSTAFAASLHSALVSAGFKG